MLKPPRVASFPFASSPSVYALEPSIGLSSCSLQAAILCPAYSSHTVTAGRSATGRPPPLSRCVGLRGILRALLKIYVPHSPSAPPHTPIATILAMNATRFSRCVGGNLGPWSTLHASLRPGMGDWSTPSLRLAFARYAIWNLPNWLSPFLGAESLGHRASVPLAGLA